MGYIIKNNQGLLVTRLTDLGRRKISEGNFKISFYKPANAKVDVDGRESASYNLPSTYGGVLNSALNIKTYFKFYFYIILLYNGFGTK